ncbi:hypothetical protein ACI2LF_25480 [Kribbella sp. NPDC020789]
MIAKLAATALLLTSLTVPANAAPAGCTLTVLPPAPGTSEAVSKVDSGDSTGRFLLGQSELPDGSAMRPVLWDNGSPRFLDKEPGIWSEAYGVNSAGTVVGQTGDPTGGSHPWTWSNGTYTELEPPAGVGQPQLSGINNRGDVVGWGYSFAQGRSVTVVWPAGGEPVVLAAPYEAIAVGISDQGVVVANVNGVGGYVWPDLQSAGRELPGLQKGYTRVQEVRGGWIGGTEELADGTKAGLLWNSAGTAVASRVRPVTSVNANGDVSLAPGLDGSVIVGRDGTQYTLPQPTVIDHLTDRGRTVSAGGNDGFHAIAWSGCFPPDHT